MKGPPETKKEREPNTYRDGSQQDLLKENRLKSNQNHAKGNSSEGSVRGGGTKSQPLKGFKKKTSAKERGEGEDQGVSCPAGRNYTVCTVRKGVQGLVDDKRERDGLSEEGG